MGYKRDVDFRNIPKNWQLEIANAYEVFQWGYDDYYESYLSMELWENPKFMLSAYKIIKEELLDDDFNFPIWRFSDNVIDSPEFLKIIKLAPNAIAKVRFKHYKKANFLKDVLQTNWRAFEYCLPRIKKSYPCVLEAVTINGLTLKHAPFSLKGEKIIVDAALKNNPRAIHYVQKTLANQSDIFTKVIKKLLPLDRYKAYSQNMFEGEIIRSNLKLIGWVYTNPQLVKMIIHFKDTEIKMALYELWLSRSSQDDVLLIAKMKKHFLA